MRVGIYTPYLDSFGGGERYVLTACEVLSKEHQVDLLLNEHLISLQPAELINRLGGHLNLDLSKINLVQAPMDGNPLSKYLFTRKYDCLIYVTDGSIFLSGAKKGFIHFQVPFKNTVARDLWGRVKLSTWDLGICNSIFTEKIISREWPIRTEVLYPPVVVEEIKPLKKEQYILSVGRFNSFTRAKKHEEMIKAFIELYQAAKIKDWSLHLAGSVEGDKKYLDELKTLAGKAPVFFYPDLSFAKLMELYGKSSIYWHAAGFGETDPAKMEHFGITTVEAMAGGCVPVVVNLGGQTVIVEDGISGFLWDNISGLTKQTLRLISNKELLDKMAQAAVARSAKFSKKNFVRRINKLVYEK